jgi:hypothetical protein
MFSTRTLLYGWFDTDVTRGTLFSSDTVPAGGDFSTSTIRGA